eukprot:1870910-Prorocentrum_lima.AAC.1
MPRRLALDIPPQQRHSSTKNHLERLVPLQDVLAFHISGGMARKRMSVHLQAKYKNKPRCSHRKLRWSGAALR